MAAQARRRVARIQVSIATAVLGVLAGLGLGRSAPSVPAVDPELAAKRVVTISGANIRDGSIAYKDLNKKSIQKGIYLKSQADKVFWKIRDAEARFIKMSNELTNYLKLTDADTRYIKLGALDGFIKLTDADARYIKLDGLNSFIKLTDADARYLKIDALDGYIKLDDANKRYVNGDGRVLTGSQLVGAGKESLLNLPGTLKVEASTGDGGALLLFTNTSTDDLELASTVPTPQGGLQHGTLKSGGSLAILIGLLQPATVQVIPGPGDGGAVHTFSFTAFGEQDGQMQVVGQALSGSPPAGG